MGTSIWLLLLLQLVLIMLNAVFACAEIAVLSVNETKLERLAEQGSKKAKRLFKLTREPAKFLAVIQVAITLSGFLGSAFAADNFAEPLVKWLIEDVGVGIPEGTLNTVAVIFITLVLSYFTLVLGELVPKRIAMKKAESLALGISGLISGIAVIFKPIVWLLSISTNAVLRLLGIDPNEVDEEVSEEEIRMMVDAGSEKGAIDQQEKEFIQNVFEFDDLTAEEISTHRTDLVLLCMEDSDEEWDATIHESRHTRYPIYDETPDDIVGILNAKDYFRLRDKSRENIMTECVRPAYFVPATLRADVLFRNMRAQRQALAVVLDEYGGVVGIVTISDLIERLVGELNDDDDDESLDEDPRIEQIDKNTWAIFGNVELCEIEEALKVSIGLDEVDTLTGLVFNELGMILSDGECDIALEYEGLQIRITSVDEHQIAKAEITVPERPDEPLEE